MTSHPSVRGWPRVSQFAIDYLLALPLGAVVALVWANTWPESYFRVTFALAPGVDQVAMTLFFGLMTKEVVEATRAGGVLHSWRRATMPVAAALGATLVPAILFVVFVVAIDKPLLQRGWPVPFGVDVALVYFIGRLIFGRHPAVPFLLLLALTADAFGFAALAVYYPSRSPHLAEAAVLMAAALAVSGGLAWARVRSFWPYVLIGGGLAWVALYRGGLHPALALMPIVPFIPGASHNHGFLVDAPARAHDPLSELERWLRYPVQITLLLFALVNAGVSIRALESGAWAIPVAALLGKPLGILLTVSAAVVFGLRLPARIGWRELVVIALAASVGFTVALYFTSAVLAPGWMLAETRMGVLLSLVGGGLAIVAARMLHVGRFERPA